MLPAGHWRYDTEEDTHAHGYARVGKWVERARDGHLGMFVRNIGTDGLGGHLAFWDGHELHLLKERAPS